MDRSPIKYTLLFGGSFSPGAVWTKYSDYPFAETMYKDITILTSMGYNTMLRYTYANGVVEDRFVTPSKTSGTVINPPAPTPPPAPSFQPSFKFNDKRNSGYLVFI